MMSLPFEINSEELQLLKDDVLLRSLHQYRKALEEMNGHDAKVASTFAEIVEHYEAEAKRRGLEA